MASIAVYEGYVKPTFGRTNKGKKMAKHSKKNSSHQKRFGAAAKRCKGSGKGFQACVKREMKK